MDIKEHIIGVAEELKPDVAEIEASVPATQNHYGRYLTIISKISDENNGKALVIALALLRAGANVHGVMSALDVQYPQVKRELVNALTDIKR